MTTISIKDWLIEFLKRRNLDRPTGKMLFTYQATAAEYQELGDLLRSLLSAPHALDRLQQSSGRKAVAAAAVLYFSECWRRVYSGGLWDWDPLLDTLGLRPDSLPSNARSRLIEEGLWFWGLQPLSTGKRFLGAVAVNGGLPSRLLAQGSGKLHQLLSSALAETERYRLTDFQLHAYLEQRQSILPDAYQQPALLELLAQLVRCVTELKIECALDSYIDPIGHLDASVNGWRARFPIALDSSTAQSLLTTLVRESAARKMPSAQDLFRCERQLVPGPEGRLILQSVVRFPARAPAEDVATFFRRTQADDLPRYFSIDLMADDRRRLVEVRAALGGEERAVRLIGAQRISRGKAALTEHVLHLVSDAGLGDAAAQVSWDCVTVPGGAALDEDDPWIFAQADDEALALVAVGAARLRQGAAVLALPAGWMIDCDEGAATQIGELAEVEPVRRLVRLTGDAALRHGSDRFQLRLNQAVQSQAQYQWRGERLPEAQGRPVFRGATLPSLYRSQVDSLVRVPATDQQWTLPGRDEVLLPKAGAGPMDVRVMADGELQARCRVMLLPSDAKIAYEPGPTIHSARIRFLHWGQAELQIESTPAITARLCADGPRGEVAFDLVAAQEPPAHVKALVRWKGCGVRMSFPLLLSYPVTGGRFVDGNGKVIGRGDRLTVQDLPGLRLQIFDANISHAKRYTLRLSAGTGTAAVAEELQIRLDHDRVELRLFEHQRRIENLMSHFDKLDVAVTVALLSAGAVVTEIAVMRYPAVLEFGEDSVRVKASGGDGTAAQCPSGVEVMACSTAALGMAPERLPFEARTDEHVVVWSTASLDRGTAAWLIFPARSSTIQFRPSILPRPSEPPVEETQAQLLVSPAEDSSQTEEAVRVISLGVAMGLPSSDQRWHALQQVFAEMEEAMDHPAWDELRNVWLALGHLPLAALDLWRVLGRQSKALLCMVLRCDLETEALAELVRRLRNEVGWTPELITRKELMVAVEAQRQRWEARLPADLVAEVHLERLERAFGVLVAEFPGIQPLVDWVFFHAGGPPSVGLIEVSRPNAQRAKNRLAQLWGGQESLVNALLLVPSADRPKWPSVGLFQRALTAFKSSCDPRFQHALAAYELFCSRLNDFKSSVANLPMLCALWSLSNAPRTFWGDGSNRRDLRFVRDFDPVWFEQAYRQSLLALMSMPEVASLLHATSQQPVVSASTSQPASAQGHESHS